jgi:phosphate:Na+ symporter
MKHLLNLLAAVALLVWGTHLVRTGILRVFGANLRHVLARSIGNRFRAAASRCRASASPRLVQSSTGHGTSSSSSFVGQGLVTALVLPPGAGRHAGRRHRHQPDGGGVLVRPVLAVAAAHLCRRGAVHLAPGLQRRPLRPGADRPGPDAAGAAPGHGVHRVLTQSPAVKALLASVGSDLLLEITVGMVLAVISYSSLAIVLLTATLAASGGIPSTWRWAWCWAPTWAAACWRC